MPKTTINDFGVAYPCLSTKCFCATCNWKSGTNQQLWNMEIVAI